MQHICQAGSLMGLFTCPQYQQADSLKQRFTEHVANFGYSFGTKEEFEFRFDIYQENESIINLHNAKGRSFTLGHNKFSTWTDAEYKKILGLKVPEGHTLAQPVHLDESNLLGSIDWRDMGAVNGVKDQGQCGSCWAFAATSTVEGAYFNTSSGTLLSLSEQQLVDCDKTCDGCDGGLPSRAFGYLSDNMQVLEDDYTYKAKTGLECKQDLYTGQAKVFGHSDVEPESITQLKAAINKVQVSISVEADKKVFQLYQEGVLDSEECGTKVDHAVTAVGYDSDENGQDYYIVRNSWGYGWGDGGYLKIAAVEGVGICGVQQISAWAVAG